MSERPDSNLTGKLLAEGFARTGPVATVLSDPIADTPMLLTLDQLAPYELDPRITRNPKYEEIKASIRERGLDSPPTITKRPGGERYIIRNGGNTRLAILRELWTETKDERFYRISCLFKPWRSEITALTGHLSENELRGGLTFIERALGVEKARELYELEVGEPLSQSELARRLAGDGFPVPRQHIGRMQETVTYLLPAIPNALYSGLGRHQVVKLAALRIAGLRLWDQRSVNLPPGDDFQTCFHEVLAGFDGSSTSFSIQRVQDELIGRLAETFDADYDSLALALSEATQMHELINSAPSVNAGEAAPLLEDDDHVSPASIPVFNPAPNSSGTTAQTAKKSSPKDTAESPLDAEPLKQSRPAAKHESMAQGQKQQDQPDPVDLRDQSYRLAHGLANAFGRSDVILQSHVGSGFSIAIGAISEGGAASGEALLMVLACLSRCMTETTPVETFVPRVEGLPLARLLLGQELHSQPSHPMRDELLNELFDLIWVLRQLEFNPSGRPSNGIASD